MRREVISKAFLFTLNYIILEGAREMLVSKESRKTAEEIAKKIEHTKPNELEKDFTHLVAENMYF